MSSSRAATASTWERVCVSFSRSSQSTAIYSWTDEFAVKPTWKCFFFSVFLVHIFDFSFDKCVYAERQRHCVSHTCSHECVLRARKKRKIGAKILNGPQYGYNDVVAVDDVEDVLWWIHIYWIADFWKKKKINKQQISSARLSRLRLSCTSALIETEISLVQIYFILFFRRIFRKSGARWDWTKIQIWNVKVDELCQCVSVMHVDIVDDFVCLLFFFFFRLSAERKMDAVAYVNAQ